MDFVNCKKVGNFVDFSKFIILWCEVLEIIKLFLLNVVIGFDGISFFLLKLIVFVVILSLVKVIICSIINNICL